MTDRPYPVVAERRLPEAPRFLFWSRRPLEDLPEIPPGTTLVVRVPGGYRVVPGDQPLTGAEPDVTEATEASVIDTRARLVTVDLPLPSSSPADDFYARMTFRCRVTDPVAVAQAGVTNLAGSLLPHLKQDPESYRIAAAYDVNDLEAVRHRLTARILTYCRQRPPTITGVTAEVLTAEILTPAALREHARKLRDERWRQERQRLWYQGEDQTIARFDAIIGGGTRMLGALGLARRSVSVQQLLDTVIAEDRRRDEAFLELTKQWAESGHLDRVVIDGQAINEALLQRLGCTGVITSGTEAYPDDAEEDDPGFADDDEPFAS